MNSTRRKRRNGDGTIYAYKVTRFRVALPMPDGSQRTKVCASYAEAEDWLVAERLKRDQGVLEWTSGKMPTLYQWMDIWIDLGAARLKPRTVDSYRAVKKRYVPAAMGHLPLNKVTALMIERLYVNLAGTAKHGAIAHGNLSVATVHQVHRVLRAAIRAAFNKGVIGHNPMTQVTAPPSPRAGKASLTMAELRLVLEAAKEDPQEALWMISLLLGLRQGESLALKWSDVDFDRKILLVERQVRRVAGDWQFSTTKEEDSRELPLDDEMIASLRRRRVEQVAARLKAGERWRDYDLVFSSTIGTPIDERNDRRRWYALLEGAGVRRVRRHDARHTAGTIGYVVTRDAKHVQRMLGHSQVAFTMATYVHPDAEALRSGADAVRKAVTG